MFDFSRRVAGWRPPLPPAMPPPPGSPRLGTSEGQPVYLPRPDPSVCSHVLCTGRSGDGKSTLLSEIYANLVAQDYALNRRERTRLLVIDRKGDCLDGVWGALAVHHPGALSEVRYANLFARGVAAGRIPFNLLHLPTGDVPVELQVQAIGAALARASTAGGVQQVAQGHVQRALATALVHAAWCADHPKRSLLWIVDALSMEGGVERLASLCRDERVRQTLLGVAAATQSARTSLLLRLQSVLCAWPELEEQLAAPSCADFSALLSCNHLCIDLSEAPAGSDEVLGVYSSLLLDCVARALISRPSNRTLQTTVCLVDEALQLPEFLDTWARPLMETTRSRGVALCWATQHLRGLREHGVVWDAISANTEYRLCSALTHADAQLVAQQCFGSATDPRAAALVRQLVSLPHRHFALIGRASATSFRVREVNFAARDAALAGHEAQLVHACRQLGAGGFERPVRLWEVGGTRTAESAGGIDAPVTRRSARPRARGRWG